MAKFSELWHEVETAQAERTSSGARMAIIEAHKVLEAALVSKKYPGKTVKEKLYWAGHSGQDKEGISEALSKHQDILENFNYNLSDFEADEIVKIYHHAVREIMKEPDFGFVDRLKALKEKYLSLKSISFWRFWGVFLGFFVLVKLLAYTQPGQGTIKLIVDLADLVISWFFVAIVMVIIAALLGLNYYLSNRSKIKIKED